MGLGVWRRQIFRYCSEITINTGTGIIGSHVFRANDLYDPDYTGTGHQPYGFDSTMAFFDHFTVTGARIKVQWHTSSTSSAIPAWCGILLSDSGARATGANSVEHLLESPLTGPVLPVGLVGAPNGESSQVVQYKSFDASRFFHRTNIVGAADYRGSASASPAESAFFEVFACSIYGNDPGTVTALVTVDYDATLTEPAVVSQS
jgi:hypothetical protein